MSTKKTALVVALFALTACGAVPNPADQECTLTSCSEAGINAPVPGIPDANNPTTPSVREPANDPMAESSYRFPEFESYWGLRREMYDKAVDYYTRNQHSFSNQRYVTVIDLSQHSSKKRWFLFDLRLVKVDAYLTSHGVNSDADNDGFAESFSDVNGSRQSSLGFYQTAETYTGSNGYSMRMDGLSSTNANARSRAIVVHPANYIDESVPRAGRSWGCPALDPSIANNVINRIKGGSLLLIDI